MGIESSAVVAPPSEGLNLEVQVALAGLLAGYSGNTRSAYHQDLRQFALWCHNQGPRAASGAAHPHRTVRSMTRTPGSGTGTATATLVAMDLDDAQAVVARHALDDYYVDHYRGMERMYLASLFEHLAEYEPMRVLEIGPGWGTTAAWLVSRGHDVTVSDHMPVGEFMAQSLVDELGVEYVHSDIEDAAAPENADLGTFDLVIMTQVIHHLAWRPDRSLRHVKELMGEGGILVSSVLDREDYPDLDSAFGDNWMDVPEWRSTERCEATVKCMYTEQEFRQLLGTQFRAVEVWKPTDSTVLFAKSANRPFSRLGRLVEAAKGFKPVGTRP